MFYGGRKVASAAGSRKVSDDASQLWTRSAEAPIPKSVSRATFGHDGRRVGQVKPARLEVS